VLYGIGIDIIEKERFQSRHSTSEFLEQVFDSKEIARGNDSIHPCDYWARIFTCKEAVLKACAIGLHFGSFWHDITFDKKFKVMLHGSMQQYITGDPKIALSHSRTRRFAVSCALVYK